MSFMDVVRTLDEVEVVAVVTTRGSGDQIATPIWSMVIDGVPYVRSVYGERGWWYRHVLAGSPVAFVIGDGAIAEQDRSAALELHRERVATEHVPADDPVQQEIDAELWRKYGATPEPVRAMLTDEAHACTLRIVDAG